jgi:hypothetical protein
MAILMSFSSTLVRLGGGQHTVYVLQMQIIIGKPELKAFRQL